MPWRGCAPSPQRLRRRLDIQLGIAVVCCERIGGAARISRPGIGNGAQFGP
jgi:hypothetical protein